MFDRQRWYVSDKKISFYLSWSCCNQIETFFGSTGTCIWWSNFYLSEIYLNCCIEANKVNFSPFSCFKLRTSGVRYQGQIQEFQNLRARSRREITFGFWGLFCCPFRYTLSLRSESRERNLCCKQCMLTKINLYAYYGVNIFKQMGVRPVLRSWIRLWLLRTPLCGLRHGTW